MFFEVIQDAVVISIVAFATCISLADLLARKHKYKIDANKVIQNNTNKSNFQISKMSTLSSYFVPAPFPFAEPCRNNLLN